MAVSVIFIQCVVSAEEATCVHQPFVAHNSPAWYRTCLRQVRYQVVTCAGKMELAPSIGNVSDVDG